MTEARNCASNVASALPSDAGIPKSVFGNCVLGSTGHWPVPSGDSPDGMGSASAANKESLLLGSALLVPVGGSPTGTGGSPVLPIFQTRSQSCGRLARSPAAKPVDSLPQESPDDDHSPSLARVRQKPSPSKPRPGNGAVLRSSGKPHPGPAC